MRPPLEAISEENASVDEAVKKLGKLLKELNIKSAFYIDDYNTEIELPLVTGIIKTIIDTGKSEDLESQLGEDIETNLPDIDTVLAKFSERWETFDSSKRSQIFKTISKIQDEDFSLNDYDKTIGLKALFPQNSLTMISPDEWAGVFKKLEEEVQNSGNILLIFDQDLVKGKHEDLTSGRVKGDDLIIQVKKSQLANKSYCTLITHLIPTIADELKKRNEIALNRGDELNEKDFFALAKRRIESPELLCDGIKKALLNGYFEKIKEKSKTIISEAQKEVIKEIDKIDTFAFDHAILISSNEEGIWEVETLLRVANIIYDEKLKGLMKETNYCADINPSIKEARKISDIRFNIPSDIYPYNASHDLRRSEIYLKGEILNSLHLPLENGDIFEVYDGDHLGLYILIAQECDLMMRNDGKREAKFGTLCKVIDQEIGLVVDEIKGFAENHGIQNHYLANKFVLDYFLDDASKVGVINFKKPILADLNALDLVVFNDNGDADSSGLLTINNNVLNSSWEKRLKKLKVFFELETKTTREIIQSIENLNPASKQMVIDGLSKNFSVGADLGTKMPFDGQGFKYGVKRVKRLRPPFCKNLLDKYAKFVSRIADMHDFAKIIGYK